MIREVMKLAGLSRDKIAERLARFGDSGVEFKVKEDCLDAAVVMSSKLDRESFERVKSLVYNAFEEEVYASDAEELHTLAAKLLKLNGKTLAVAESLTGGEICSRLASVAGISENLYEGIVCYNKNSKIERLGVPRSCINAYGAVSRETAHAMVEGLNRPPVDIALATTGLAGPSGDEGKPVGLVYIGVGGGEFITVFEKRFSGTRNEIRSMAANLALFYLIRYLKGDILRL